MMHMNKLFRPSVGADLSCTPPIYRPSVDVSISCFICSCASLRPYESPGKIKHLAEYYHAPKGLSKRVMARESQRRFWILRDASFIISLNQSRPGSNPSAHSKSCKARW